jgi:hypothetical protein
MGYEVMTAWGFPGGKMHCRLLLVVVSVAALAGCAAPNALTPEQVASFRLSGVNVGFAPDARIMWGDGERAYAESKGVAAYASDTVANTPEGQAYLRNTIAAKVKGAMLDRLGERLNGSRPVRVEVTVTKFIVSSAIQRVIVGGGHQLMGDVSLVDAKTGETLAVRPELVAVVAAGQGVVGVLAEQMFNPQPVDELAKLYATLYGFWLARK